jgi:hypothetical protein
MLLKTKGCDTSSALSCIYAHETEQALVNTSPAVTIRFCRREMASRAYAPLDEETPASVVEESLANRIALLERENSTLKDELSTLKRGRGSEPADDQAKVLVPKRRKSGDQENLPVLRLDDKAKLRLLKKWGSSVGKCAPQL